MPSDGDEERTSGQKTFAVLGYMLCSSLMLLANKLAIHYLQTPLFVLFAQLAGTAIVVIIARLLGLITKPIFTSWKTALAFAPAPIAFLGTIFSNIKVLQYANVETFIVFRSSTPLLISIADYAMMGREFPSRRSMLCLVIILLGAVGYVKSDSNFQLRGYLWCVSSLLLCFNTHHGVRASIAAHTALDPAASHYVPPRCCSSWRRAAFDTHTHTHTHVNHAHTHTHTHATRRVFIWYVVFSIDQLYIKFIINKTKQLMTTWGRVFVTNALGAVILAPLVLLSTEPATLATLDWHKPARVGWFAVSIAIGVCMGYFAMSARTAVSATYFTVIGNVCKILTVFVNFFIWDHHASPGGLASLGICLVAAYFYEQAPLTKATLKKEQDVESAV